MLSAAFETVDGPYSAWALVLHWEFAESSSISERVSATKRGKRLMGLQGAGRGLCNPIAELEVKREKYVIRERGKRA